MSDQPTTAPPTGNETPMVRSEHSGAFLRLATLWRRRNHFSLVFATCDNPRYRDSLIARLQAEAPAGRLDLGEADPPGAWLDGAVRAHQQGGYSRLHICLPLGQARGADWWQRANLLRERLAEALPAVQVLWLTDADVQAAAHHAPDLWNWREAVLGFCAVPAEQATTSVPGLQFDEASAMEAAALQTRLSAIEDLLETRTDLDPGVAHLLLEAAGAHERFGQWSRSADAAERAARAFEALDDASGAAQAHAQAAHILRLQGQVDLALQRLRQLVLPVYERLGDQHSRAVTMGRIADILQARGELDEALRIRREEELPVYERFGDQRSQAVTQDRISDVLQARGDLDEALRIRREKVLPVYVNLGDQRARAVTMGKVADVLQARGELDEALRIRREEELPVYERLGDKRERAVIMCKIAEIAQARGEYDEALRIVREDALPVFESLGDKHSVLACRANLASLMLRHGLAADRAEADDLLRCAHLAAQELQLPEARQIAQTYQQAFGRPIAPQPPSTEG